MVRNFPMRICFCSDFQKGEWKMVWNEWIEAPKPLRASKSEFILYLIEGRPELGPSKHYVTCVANTLDRDDLNLKCDKQRCNCPLHLEIATTSLILYLTVLGYSLSRNV
jgi:hypothetical protein